MNRVAVVVLLAFATISNAGRLTTFAWDPAADWPPGTTVEICGTGDVCASGITATQHTLDLPVTPGDAIQGRARAIPPPDYNCQNPDGDCRSGWAEVVATWPMPPSPTLAIQKPLLKGADIGGVGLAGSTSHANGTYTVKGSGADIYGTSDAFHFAHQSMTGNVTITARVDSLTNTDPFAKAGVMIRESLDADARHALVTLTPGNGIRFIRRTITGGPSEATPGAAVTTPYWVKLTRAGTSLIAHQSYDGVTWDQVGSPILIDMSDSVYVGLAVTSKKNATLATAVFFAPAN